MNEIPPYLLVVAIVVNGQQEGQRFLAVDLAQPEDALSNLMREASLLMLQAQSKELAALKAAQPPTP